MRNLIMDLLDFTKIRLERKDEKIQEVDLEEIARGAMTTVQPYAIQMEVELRLDVKKDSVILADPEDIEIIFNNLISNAVKYNKVGGRAEIVIDSTEDEAVITFSDTGIGISDEDQKNLYTEFMRVKNERTRNI